MRLVAAGATTLLIAHRFAPAHLADRSAVLERGESAHIAHTMKCFAQGREAG